MDIKLKFHDFSHVLVECDEGIFYELRDFFSFEAEGYKFNPKFRYGQWDGRIRLLGYDRLLPFGLVNQVQKFASNMGYKVYADPMIFEKEEITQESFDKWLDSKEIYSGLTKITPHWYQKEAVFKGLKERRALLNLPTSAGKSLIQALLSRYYVENYEGKILIIVPTTALVDQMIDDFCDYRLFKRDNMLGIRSGTKKDSSAVVYVSTWQTAIKQPKEWFSQFGLMMNDECHLATGKSISTIIAGLNNCMFKFGLSGSLKDGKANLMQYQGLFGDIFKPVSTSQLMEEGAVTELKINAIRLRYPDNVTVALKGKTYQEEIKYITSVKRRNKWIANLAVKLASKNQNAFVMFKNISHGKELFQMIKDLGHDKVFYVSGEIDTDTRTALKKMAENETGIVVVASYGVFSTGISIKNLHHVILAHGVKSKIIVLQTIGRVLRKHGSKDVATVWDIIDDCGVKPKSANAKKTYTHINYLLKHGLERIQRYADEKFDYVMKLVEL
ncbi:helicase [Klebsiella phage PhiKpNIH-6]|uniref:DNA helicase n=5 Tax=Marfavirus F48 TaxID=2845079 RepID=A0A5P8PKI2_9CAUD|nr:DNA helicase [Klebsiella phage vB_Kpn_F48]QEG12840.1 putative DNA helicase [Klebsiella phage vB_KpnM_Potts1]QFR57169.1 DNA helicase [Klebsiella phage AmPh_EK29]QGZ15313.1 DNA helicase [Klebsiella phage vB_Kpn_P545]QHB49544.1 helicase [Klebsiella phage PhiKpNIH-6]UEP19453.1 DNA helicase [Klebsiella phage vB_KpnM-VAC36]UJD05933.1 DNA helicase [Klebsiella phage PWKp18]WKC55817.1 ATP-dependent DNA helicase [Klebsiella phage R3_1]WLJ69937.1 DNA helicase [Klebsiella phage Kpn BM7]